MSDPGIGASQHMGNSANSIAKRSGRMFAILGACAIVWFAIGLYASRSQGDALERMGVASSALRDQMQADMDHDAIRGAVMSILAAEQFPAIDKRQAAEDLKGYIAEFKALVEHTRQFEDSAEVRQSADAVVADLTRFVAASEAISASAMRGQPVDSGNLAAFSQAFEELEGSMANIGDELEKHSEKTQQEAERAGIIAEAIQFACFFVIALSLLIIWRNFRNQLIQPVIDLRHGLDQLAAGDLDTAIEHSERNDEVGSLARSASLLRDQLKGADEHRREQANVIVESVGAALAQLAQGNLTVRVTQNLEGIFSRLKTDFNSAVEQLSQTLLAVRSATGMMDNTGAEINHAVGDLSIRNEEQASKLMQITERLSAVTSQVTTSAEMISSVQTTVRDVNSEVAQGDRVIQSAVEAMYRIEGSSNEISSIISVIDGISFQTNLLALNAGVEAARAGDSGRGFAVVANEVRALAQRSADAAAQIKGLIEASSKEVETGVRLVREAGGTLQAITGSMSDIAGVIDNASASAQQQVNSLREVDAGAKALEVITQSNAALAEEVSASTRQAVEVTNRANAQLDTFTLAPSAAKVPEFVDEPEQARAA